VIAGGLALTALAAVCALFSSGYLALGVFLLVGGAASASANAASGRVVLGWFPQHRRGFAMGIRQIAQPLGVTVSAVTIPGIAQRSGVAGALIVPLALTAVLTIVCAIVILDPPRRARAADAPAAVNPYRASSFLWRIHAVSALLVLPQFLLSTFGLVWLVAGAGWDPLAAGVLVGISQFVGAAGRIGVGALSDRVGSRVRPLRWVAVSAAAVMLALGAADAAHFAGAAVVFVIATSVTVADNGLAFTSVAETAGHHWAGRALGAQNTAQFLVASLASPLFGALIGVVGYPASFAISAIAPLVAIPLVPPVAAERDAL
jgi:sugar phosphate permease